MTGDDRTERIRSLNDKLRQEGIGGRLYITSGLQGEGQAFVAKVLAAVAAFDRFTPDNDPHGEHDFGKIEVDNVVVFFKIDYYDISLSKGSEDPADPTITARVLTVMLAEEY